MAQSILALFPFFLATTFPSATATKEAFRPAIWNVDGANHNGDIAVAGGLPNANHIFNAVHNAMKQWGNTLQHNGMSFFIASVPADTELYHGTSTPYRVNGTEWLAFEPEHAMIFAARGPPPGGRGPPEDHEPSDDHVLPGEPPEPSKHNGAHERDHAPRPRKRLGAGNHQRNTVHSERHPPFDGPSDNCRAKNQDPRPGIFDWLRLPFLQAPVREHDDDPVRGAPGDRNLFGDQTGYFHTYRTKRTTRLLYVDGQSAAKSTKGTLDTQDIVLRRPMAHRLERDSRRRGGPMGENERAAQLCAMAKTDWQGKIDGILRMEGGFEIIMCDFADTLDVVEIHQVTRNGQPGPGPGGMGNADYEHAIAARFDGIGGERVYIDYEHSFISLYAFPNAVYFEKDTGLPRVRNDSSSLAPARKAIDKLISADEVPNARRSINWQAIADMVVARYAQKLEYLTDLRPKWEAELLQQELKSALNPFIDHRNANDAQQIIRRCASQHLPSTYDTDSLAAQAVAAVTETICTQLHAAATAPNDETAFKIVGELKQWLGWADFKRRACQACGVREICSLPLWPMGSKKDLEHPSCSNGSRGRRGDGYWDMPGRPGGPPSGGPSDLR